MSMDPQDPDYDREPSPDEIAPPSGAERGCQSCGRPSCRCIEFSGWFDSLTEAQIDAVCEDAQIPFEAGYAVAAKRAREALNEWLNHKVGCAREGPAN
jgi:hypothetical protein